MTDIQEFLIRLEHALIRAKQRRFGPPYLTDEQLQRRVAEGELPWMLREGMIG